MFSWAASTFESLVQTVAPPPSDPNAKIVLCCQQGNEQGALECLQNQPSHNDEGNPINPIDPARTVVVQLRGYTALHLACLHAMPQLLDYILSCNDLGETIWQVLDIDANTPLHCACMSNNANALSIVKKILLYPVSASVGGASGGPPTVNTALVLRKNSRGETPYDVASLNSVRQYLLPIQLQAETQFAIDNGGVGLPPGIDMGGLKIQYNHLPPPPTTQQQPPPPMGYSASSVGGGPISRYAAPPMPTFGGGIGQFQMQQQHYASQPPTPQTQTPQPFQTVYQQPPSNYQQPQTSSMPPFQASAQSQPIVPLHSSPAVSATEYTSNNVSSYQAPSNPSVTTSTTPKAPPIEESPRSGGYSLVGRSSAAIQPRSGNRILPNDGFHSSSSDKNLQAKYGHATVTRNPALPPPPSSGNSSLPGSIATSSNSPLSGGPPSMSSTGSNPFAAGEAALGNTRRAPAANRYVSYGTSVTPLPPPPPPVSGGSAYRVAPVTPTFAMFTPGSKSNGFTETGTASNAGSQLQQQQPKQAVATTTPKYSFPPLPPPPSIGSKTASFNNNASASASSNMTLPFSSPNPHLLTQPTPTNTPLSPGPAHGSPEKSNVHLSTQSLFGTPPAANNSVSSPQDDLLLGDTYKKNLPPQISSNATDVFGSPQSHPSSSQHQRPSFADAHNVFSSAPESSAEENVTQNPHQAFVTTVVPTATSMDSPQRKSTSQEFLSPSVVNADPVSVFATSKPSEITSPFHRIPPDITSDVVSEVASGLESFVFQPPPPEQLSPSRVTSNTSTGNIENRTEVGNGDVPCQDDISRTMPTSTTPSLSEVAESVQDDDEDMMDEIPLTPATVAEFPRSVLGSDERPLHQSTNNEIGLPPPPPLQFLTK